MIKYMTIKELNEKYSSENVAKALTRKVCLWGQKVQERPKMTEAERRHAFVVSRIRRMLESDRRA